MTFVEGGHGGGIGTTAMRSCSGGEIGRNSKYSMSKWEFIVREQSGGQWMENY